MADTPFTTFGFKSTGGTANRTMPDRLAEVFNVKNYGAVGDSTNFINGTDDRAAIQAAVDAAAAIDIGSGVRGATVYLPRGVYHVSGPINFDTERAVSMMGDYPSASGIGGSFADFVLNNEGQNGATLSGVKYLQVNNSYKNYLTSCSYASAGSASASVGSVSGTVLTITSGVSGTFAVGQIITGTGVTYNSIIISLGTGSGGTGTYNLNKISSSTGSIVVTASNAGIVTFGTQNAIDNPANSYYIAIGSQFHTFGMFPRAYTGRYIAVAGTTGSTLVGVGNCSSDPGTVTMLGAIGGGGIRMDTAEESSIEKCIVFAFNALHLGGSYGYGSNFATSPYNVFGVSVRDTVFGAGGVEYGTVGAFCGQVSFHSCGVSQTDWGVVASSNGFGFFNGHIENNRVGISVGRSDQLIANACGAWSIVSNHTEDCDIAVEICSGNQGFMAANQWTGQHRAGGTHLGVNFTGTTASSTTITSIAATVVTGNTRIHSPRITNLSTVTGLYNGMAISGTGIPSGSFILTLDSSSALTFLNAAGTNESPLGASATGSTVSITATVAAGMRVSGTNIPSDACVASVGSVSGGNYTATLNKTTTGAGTNSFNFNPTPTHGILFTPSRLSGAVGNCVVVGNTTSSVSYSVAGVDISEVGGNPTFINNSSGPTTGLGVPWSIPVHGVAPAGSPAGVIFIGCDNQSAAIPFAALPAAPIEGMQFDITDCNTSTFLATAAAGGSGATAHRRVRYNAVSSVWQVVG